jgi:hypothetical protein
MTKKIHITVLGDVAQDIIVHTQLAYEEQPVAPIIIRD